MFWLCSGSVGRRNPSKLEPKAIETCFKPSTFSWNHCSPQLCSSILFRFFCRGFRVSSHIVTSLLILVRAIISKPRKMRGGWGCLECLQVSPDTVRNIMIITAHQETRITSTPHSQNGIYDPSPRPSESKIPTTPHKILPRALWGQMFHNLEPWICACHPCSWAMLRWHSRYTSPICAGNDTPPQANHRQMKRLLHVALSTENCTKARECPS